LVFLFPCGARKTRDTVTEIIGSLENAAEPSRLSGMARYGMATQGWLGVNMPALRDQAKKIGKNYFFVSLFCLFHHR
jgi:3-methyladenine DNA glycosylase AlkD